MIKCKKIALGFRVAALLTATAGLLDLLGIFQGNMYTGVDAFEQIIVLYKSVSASRVAVRFI